MKYVLKLHSNQLTTWSISQSEVRSSYSMFDKQIIMLFKKKTDLPRL